MSNLNALLSNFLGENTPSTTSLEEKFSIVKSERMATAQQVSTYVRLCEEKGINFIQSCETWTYDKMSVEINKLLQMKRIQPISEGQKSTIIDICNRNGWELPDMKGLSGGRNGSASGLIQELMDLERNFNNTRPLTEAQKQMILDMYYCPDILFEELNEDFGTVKCIMEDKIYWTRVNLDEMTAMLEDRVTQSQARDFLNKYKGVFYDWKITRLTENQMRRIQRLQERCYMSPMNDTALLQFSKKDAERYIAMLESSLRDREITKFEYESNRETILERTNKDRVRIANKENLQLVNELHDEHVESLIHMLYASLGQSGRDEDVDNMNDEEMKELIALASEMNGKEAIRELASEILTEDEIVEIFGENKEMEEEQKQDTANQICEEIVKMAMSSPLELRKNNRIYKLAVQRIYDNKLINKQIYHDMQRLFEKVGV